MFLFRSERKRLQRIRTEKTLKRENFSCELRQKAYIFREAQLKVGRPDLKKVV